MKTTEFISGVNMSLRPNKKRKTKDVWQIQEAKAHFSQLIDAVEAY